MRTLVTLMAVALLLTGCFESPKKLAIRDSLIRLQAELDNGITLSALQMRLTMLDADVRTAVLDNAISNDLAQQLDVTLKLGRQVEKAWRTNFYCLGEQWVERVCLPKIFATFSEIGAPDHIMAEWQRREAEDVAADKEEAAKVPAELKKLKRNFITLDVNAKTKELQESAMSLTPFQHQEAVEVLLSVLNDRIGKTVAAFQH